MLKVCKLYLLCSGGERKYAVFESICSKYIAVKFSFSFTRAVFSVIATWGKQSKFFQRVAKIFSLIEPDQLGRALLGQLVRVSKFCTSLLTCWLIKRKQ